MNGTIDLLFWQLAAAYLFVILLIVIVRIKGIPREKEILIATARMTLQLILVGYLLVYVFGHAHPVYTLLLVAVMLVFSIRTINKRAKGKLSKAMKRSIAFSMTSGILVSLLYFIFIVLQLAPWYEPRYVIPIAGMIVGNSMTGIALGVNSLTEGMHGQKDKVEAALMLGATPKMAAREIVNQAFDSAMLPTINSMVGMGIVFLPGMMTGQILSGTSPIVAVEYQIAIMLGIVGSVSLSVILFVQLGYRTFFNHRSQLEL
ncbi:putative ABC transport system permease protein [Paenibacillus sophorae]|uniref:Iron export ABC transporter permease subunit FetB n=1 Tax=Paenibacillus sophorae TaxID=1333845 RepID=A0A1H8KCY4_9BACL|nr:iron export ABC transporter permease subunit FetB [Paenibacillus sophorae]QWU13707.1 iron export ABC transporter permease subunit FetB [Paenibacillus sophorae]SEN90889.1 putative ABC transport system permease protein [Paenibacillus sophorae]